MYYDEVTPENYEPTGFKPAENNDLQLPPGCVNVSAGEIGTGHHGVKVRVQAKPKQLQEKEQPSFVSNNYSASASESDTDPWVTVEDVIFETTLATATATASTSEVSKCCREDIYYGPPPPVARYALALTYSEHGGAMVVQVDSVHHQ